MKNLKAILIFFVLTAAGFAQKSETAKNGSTENARQTAEKALAAHGGENFKKMKTLSVAGGVDVTVSTFNQSIPASFATIFSGEKYLLEIKSPYANFRQISDGVNTYTSPQTGFNLPPVNRLGAPLLQKLGDEGYVVSELPDGKKFGFRMTSPEGYFTDFFIDKKTMRIKGFEAKYTVNGREVSTLVEVSKFEEKNGIVIPSKYAQRFEVSGMTVYAEFSAKEIKINEEISEEIFGLE